MGRLAATNERSRRIAYLCFGIVLMSLVDLYLTLLFLTRVGMLEANPLARAVMSLNSTELVIAWKLASVGLCVGILIATRRSRTAEIGAWIACAVLAWLSFVWIEYADSVVAGVPLTGESMAELGDPRWVSITRAS